MIDDGPYPARTLVSACWIEKKIATASPITTVHIAVSLVSIRSPNFVDASKACLLPRPATGAPPPHSPSNDPQFRCQQIMAQEEHLDFLPCVFQALVVGCNKREETQERSLV